MDKTITKMSTKDSILLKPVEPTELWTIENGLHQLKEKQNLSMNQALKEFLMLNTELVFQSDPFRKKDKIKIEKKGEEMILRGILYTKISEDIEKNAEKISQELEFEYDEVLRVLVQTGKKITQKKRKVRASVRSIFGSQCTDEMEDQIIFFYVSKILKERRSVLEIANELLIQRNDVYTPATIKKLGDELFESESYTWSLIKSIEDNTNIYIEEKQKTKFTGKTSEIFYTESIFFLITLHKVLIEILIQKPNKDKKMVEKWFQIMNKHNYFLKIKSFFSHKESFDFLVGLSTIVSVLFLELEKCFDKSCYYSSNYFGNNITSFITVHDLIVDSNNINSVILYSWLSILIRKYYFVNEYQNNVFSVELQKKISLQNIIFNINELNARCLKLEIFKQLFYLNEMLKYDNNYSCVLFFVIFSMLPLIILTPEISRTIQSIMSNCPDWVIEKFFECDESLNAIILTRSKFPLLLTPFLNFASINGSFAFNELNEMKSYMAIFNKLKFMNYYQINDDDTDLIKMTKSIEIPNPLISSDEPFLVIEKGVRAKILPSKKNDEILVVFLYNYNGWFLLGTFLQNILDNFEFNDENKINFFDDVVKLLIKIVANISIDKLKFVLDSMSKYTNDLDVFDVFFKLFERFLHLKNTHILKNCIYLISHLLPIYSSKIWHYLSKSSFFFNNDDESIISIIFGAIEVVSGDYSFTLALIKLTDVMVENSILFCDLNQDKLKKKIFNNLVSHLLFVFEFLNDSKFSRSSQKIDLNISILDVFSNILSIHHSINKNLYVNRSKSFFFYEASKLILNSFLTSDSSSLKSLYPISKILNSILFEYSIHQLNDDSGFLYNEWVRCILSYSQLLVTIRSSIKLTPSYFEKELFECFPKLVLLYSQHEEFKKEVLNLMTCLTKSVWKTENNSSILSHLNQDYAKILLNVLSGDLTNSFNNYDIKIALYDFICSVLESKEEGLSIFFTSEDDVFNDFNEDDKIENHEKSKSVSLLNVLKKNIKDFNYRPDFVNINLIDAIFLIFNSQNTASDNYEDINFIDELIEKIKVSLDDEPQKSNEYIDLCYKLKFLSKIYETLSIIFFKLNNKTCIKRIESFIKSDFFFNVFKSSFIINDHKKISQKELHEKFKQKFPDFDLSQFATCFTKRNRFGIGAVYNLLFMDRIFKTNPNWPDFRNELILASVISQYLSTQFYFSKSIGLLITSYCKKSDSQLDSRFLVLAKHLLKLSVSEDQLDGDFSEFFYDRINLSFFLIYSFLKKNQSHETTEEVFELLKTSFKLLSSFTIDFNQNSSDLQIHHRKLLKIIYCLLELLRNEKNVSIEYNFVLKGIFDLVIVKGTLNFLDQLENDVHTLSSDKKKFQLKINSSLNDFVLTFSILKTFVKINSNNLNNSIGKILENEEIIKALLKLYSFSHFIKINNECIFTQLSLNFIQELMLLGNTSEKVASNGLFIVLMNSPISLMIKNGCINPLSTPHLHKVWNDGILPIIMLSLAKLSPKYFVDICFLIKFFAKQIDYCLESWFQNSSIIRIFSSTISETGKLLFLFELLKKIKLNEYFLLLNPSESPYDNQIDMPLLPSLETTIKRDAFINCINNLLKHPKFLVSRVTPCTIKEKRIFESRNLTYMKFVKSLIEEICYLKSFLV